MNKNQKVEIIIPGNTIGKPELPRVLRQSARTTANPQGNVFFPPSLITVSREWDLSRSARSLRTGDDEPVEFDPEQLLAIEFDDGLTIFTRADRLEETLANLTPESETPSIEILRDRGPNSRGFSDFVARIFAIGIDTDEIIEEAKEKAKEWAKNKIGDATGIDFDEVAGLGVTRLGTKALMWSVEKRMDQQPGLYRWDAAADSGNEFEVATDSMLRDASNEGPIVLFIHGTASSTEGSFGDLGKTAPAWSRLKQRFDTRIFALEHYTLSESPIENALAAARELPTGCRLNLVTHSRGGLVGDLLCLKDLSDETIRSFTREHSELTDADAEDQENLRELIRLLKQKQFRIERYVRVACPARGTRLASGNFDAFLSALLRLIGMVPFLAGQPVYYAFKRAVLEIAKNRTDPALVPGLEAMIPESPFGALLAHATPPENLELGIIAGDIEGGGFLKRLGVFFTDNIFFDRLDNDLVVDRDSMYTGVARPGVSRHYSCQSPQVSHFNYFENDDSRDALLEWLSASDSANVSAFTSLPSPQSDLAEMTRGSEEEVDNSHLPVVILLPGVMGSHLERQAENDRIWFDPADIVVGRLHKISWNKEGIAAEKLFSKFYGGLAKFLGKTHRVVPFAYDWRQPLDVLGNQLAEKIQEVQQTTTQPIRLLAHSMGGLVVRSMVHQHEGLWKKLIQTDGARLVMLGTPNQGSHKMVETLVGKSSTIRTLARADLKHNLKEVLDLVAEFPGVLQLLPKPEFCLPEQEAENYFSINLWKEYKKLSKDFWFGDGACAVPTEQSLAAGRWLWDQDGQQQPSLPDYGRSKTLYVFGIADVTPSGIRIKRKRIKMVGTRKGDGTVAWDSGRIGGIGHYYYMPASHGDLLNTEEYFDGIADLLEVGETTQLSDSEPVFRGAEQEIIYDAGPQPYPTDDELIRSLMDASALTMEKVAPQNELSISCTAMDLRYINKPIMVGHYQQDVISGAEAVIDSVLMNGELTQLENLGLYAGPIGTSAVIIPKQTSQEKLRDSYRGVIIAGLGEYGQLCRSSLSSAVRLACLKLLLEIADKRIIPGKHCRATGYGIHISSLLLGFNSTANLTVEDSVGAILRGVLDANRQFRETKGLPIYIAGLEFIELYIDTAISITHALERVAKRFNQNSRRHGFHVTAQSELLQREGCLKRLDITESKSHWPRMIVADADSNEDKYPLPNGSRTAIGERLRFVYLGGRARAETIIQQRQPELVEKLIAKSVGQRNYDENLSRSLFQLLVPYDFKEAARQMNNMLLVVDTYTANLPWELLIADSEPLAVKTPMVRQLSSTRYRLKVQSTLEKTAYVIGNPSSEGFAAGFTEPSKKESRDPDSLPGAEKEAITVSSTLARQGYRVKEAIGEDQKALDVINKLYQCHYKIVHIAAHGVFDIRHRDGKVRSGVVLSDGLLLTAAEISSMDVVPNLVFLNCCHLGKIDRGTIHFNRLAYSVARELIEIGVNAVVVAGWAVDDEAAKLFAETFYDKLIAENLPFGESVFRARRKTYEQHPHSNTWGAYQAYGDPMFRISPREKIGGNGSSEQRVPVATDELLNKLSQERSRIVNMNSLPKQAKLDKIARDIRTLLERCPAHWKKLPHVNAALGDLFTELGSKFFPDARSFYENAINPQDNNGLVPIRAIEQLANLEARQGEEQDDLRLINHAIKRLDTLLSACNVQTPNPERSGLMGSAYKRKAAVLAKKAIPGPDFMNALETSVDWYKKAEGSPGAAEFSPYHALNRIGLETTAQIHRRKTPEAPLQLITKCAEKARQNFRTSPDFWNAIMPADAELVRYLVNGELKAADEKGEKAEVRIIAAYQSAQYGVASNPRMMKSVIQHIHLLSSLFNACASVNGGKSAIAATERLTKRLKSIASKIESTDC